jgi:protein gp37
MSKIEWTNETWNPVTGCTKYSEGCKNCYAEKMHKRLRGMKSAKYQHDFNKIVCHPKELERDFGKTRKMIFVNSMSDIFHDDIPDDFIYKVFWAAARNYPHIFQFLTKRPFKNQPCKFACLPHMPNIWLGVSVENRKAKKRIELLKYPGHNFAVKFLSCEPLLEDLGELDLSGIDWVICGGESGPGARPMHPDWVRNIQKQCQEQNVPFFFKQWGEWIPSLQQYRIKSTREAILLNDGQIIDGISPKDVKQWEQSTGQTIDDKRGVIVLRLGKKKSGSLLDGKEYKEFPEVK